MARQHSPTHSNTAAVHCSSAVNSPRTCAQKGLSQALTPPGSTPCALTSAVIGAEWTQLSQKPHITQPESPLTAVMQRKTCMTASAVWDSWTQRNNNIILDLKAPEIWESVNTGCLGWSWLFFQGVSVFEFHGYSHHLQWFLSPPK